MTPEQFIFWLSGILDINCTLSMEATDKVKTQLDLVKANLNPPPPTNYVATRNVNFEDMLRNDIREIGDRVIKTQLGS